MVVQVLKDKRSHLVAIIKGMYLLRKVSSAAVDRRFSPRSRNGL